MRTIVTHGKYISIIANFAKAIRVSESLESLRQWLAALAASLLTTVGSLRVVVVYFPDGVVALFLQVVIWVQAGACGAQDPERRARCE
jgi:hypothetical protein